MARKQRREYRSREFWEATVGEFSASGLSQRAFAQDKGVKTGTLANWVKKIRQPEQALIQPQFIEVVSSPVKQSSTPTATRLLIGDVAVEFSDLPPVRYVADLLREVTAC